MLGPVARFVAAASTHSCRWRPRVPDVAACRNQGFYRRAGSVAQGTPRILTTDVNDILFHFSVEEHLMMKEKLAGPLMYLWRPSPVITIGRHQNPWKECVLSKLEEDGVSLARRRSGGGAVYQDLGCSVFTFIGPSNTFSIDRNFDVVVGALARLGVKAERSGRNDMTVDGKKISGSAFRHAPDLGVSLHHGTILVDTDFTALQRYLTPDKRKLAAKGIASVGARVLNLKDSYPHINHKSWSDAMVSTFKDVVCEGAHVPIEQVGENSEIAQSEDFATLRAEIGDHEWRFGRTPEFSHQLDTRIDGIAVFDVRMQVIGGRIEEAVIYSDALYPEVIDKAMAAMTGATYGQRGLRAAFEAVRSDIAGEGPSACFEALTQWLLANIDD